MFKHSKNYLIPVLMLCLCLCESTINIRHEMNHYQIPLYADVINTSNHMDPQPSADPTSTTQASKFPVGWIIALICIVFCLISCFFCCRCLLNQKKQAEENPPCCYSKWCATFCKPCQYLLLFDCILKFLGLRQSNKQRKQRLRIQEEEKFKKQEQKLRKKLQKQQKKMNKSKMMEQKNPYQQKPMNKQQGNSIWHPIQLSSQQAKHLQKLKCQKCAICNKKQANSICFCSLRCVMHLQCVLDQPQQPKSKSLCPNCKTQYFNTVKYFCKKCKNQYTDVVLSKGNVYATQINVKDVMKTINNGKCGDCSKKGFFW